MRVLFIIYGSLDQVSGGYLYDRKVIEYLRSEGIEVDILGLPVLPYLLCPMHFFHPQLKRLFRTPGAARRYQCIVVDELTHPSLFLSVARRVEDCPPVLLLLHHLSSREPAGWARRRIARFMEKILVGRSDGVVVNSRSTESTVRDLIEEPPPFYLCPPGSDALSGKRPGGDPTDGDPAGCLIHPGGRAPVRLLVTGNVIFRKGHDLLIRLLGGLRDLDWELRIVGGLVDRPYKRRLDRVAARCGLESRICYTGVLDGEALRQEYAAADIFLFPSRYEGFGISLAEAVRAGLPFIAFRSGAIPELTGGRGLLVPEGDTRSFQEHLGRLIADPQRRAQAAALSERLAADLATWADTGAAFLQAVEGVTDRARLA
jgi:glycosyltransferase involved in cell wall biosynthesis